MIATIRGFIILGPGHPPEMGAHTFGRTQGEAWIRHLGGWKGDETEGDRADMRNRWSQKGWRPVPATMNVEVPG